MEALPYILLINGALLALFLAWVLANQWWQRLIEKLFPKRIVVPPFGASVKIRTLGAVYDTRFLGQTREGWAIESLAHAIPTIRLGETALVEIACPRGVVRFKTEFVELLNRENATIMRPPLETPLGNRRNRNRVILDEKPCVYLEGENSRIHDLSEAGAKISTNYPLSRGDRVRVDIPGKADPIMGHVLEVIPNVTRGYRNDVRLTFEEPVRIRELKKKLAPAG